MEEDKVTSMSSETLNY